MKQLFPFITIFIFP